MNPSPASRAASAEHRGDLILFMILAFVLSWGSWLVTIAMGESPMAPGSAAMLPYAFGAFGPMIAALVIRIRRGRRGEPVPEHAVRFRPKALIWTPLLLVLGSALVLGASFLASVAGGPAPTAEHAMQVLYSNPAGPAAFLLTMVLVGPLSEEPGWRGTAYPRLRAKLNPVQVGLVLGAVWAVWHLPLFFVTGTPQHELGLASPSGALYFASSLPMAMFVCYAYERGGVVAAVAVHFAVNTTMVLVGVQAPVTLALIIGILAIAAVALLATVRPAGKRGADGAASAPGVAAPSPGGGAHTR